MNILARQQIERLLSIPDILEAIEQGFIAFRGIKYMPRILEWIRH